MNRPAKKTSLYPFITLVASIGLGLLAVILVNAFVQREVGKVSGGKLVEVAFATVDIPANTEITEEMISSRPMPEAFAQIQAVRYEDRNFLVGQATKNEVLKGNPVRWSDMALTDPRGALISLETEMRALTIPAGDSGVNTLLRPGDRVDVISTVTVPSSDYSGVDTQTLLLLQDIPVLAINGSAVYGQEEQGKAPPAVQNLTLRLPVRDAMLLTFALQRSTIKILQRGRFDLVTQKIAPVTMKDLSDLATSLGGQPGSSGAPQIEGYPSVSEGGADAGSGYFLNPARKDETTPESGINSELLQRLRRDSQSPLERDILDRLEGNAPEASPEASPEATPEASPSATPTPSPTP